MAESREKSDGLREQFEADYRRRHPHSSILIRNTTGTYILTALQIEWEGFQFGEKIGWEAGRRDALEEAAKAQCHMCREHGAPVKIANGSLAHRLPGVRFAQTCLAAAIRALET